VERTCSTYWEGRNVYGVLIGRAERKKPLGRPRRRWKHNIKMDLRELGIDGVNWIRLTQNRVQGRVFVNTVMNLPIISMVQDIL
jgi:hypothetical protein